MENAAPARIEGEIASEGPLASSAAAGRGGSIDRWTQSLRAAADRLLDAADHGVPLAGDPVRLVFSLLNGTRFQIESAAAPGLEAGCIKLDLPPAELATKVSALRRAARDALADGEHVLWLAIGVLTWTDADAHAHAAPLVLWPVALDRDAAGVTRVVAAPDRTPRTNAALAARLRALHGVELDLDQGFELDLVRVLDHATALAAERPGWRVERSMRLGTFAFAPFDLAADLRDLRDAGLASPARWLGGDAPVPPLPAPLPADELVAPLDADASQLAALAVAAAGGSFVLTGAPGTGKTQTIANLVVHMASRGHQVLVVSDRRAALDAIRRRLDAVGLAELCAFAGDAAQAMPRLTTRGSLGSGPTLGRTRLAEMTERLDRHVAAMHGSSGLGMSVHDALARLVELRTVPNAALEELDAESLDRAAFERRRTAATELAAAATAVEPAALHPWRASALDAWDAARGARVADALSIADEAATALAGALVELAALVPGLQTRTAEQLAAVGKLAELAAASPRPGAELLAGGRGRNADDVGERVALIRARGAGSIETPRDPAAFAAIAERHRALAAEVVESFGGGTELDADVLARVDALDATELWTQLKRWTTSVAPLRYVALRKVRAAVHAAATPGVLAADAGMLVALEAAFAERACRAALAAGAEPARRWFGELLVNWQEKHCSGDSCQELDPLTAALAWAVELRRAFDQVSVAGGESVRAAAWRALVAQVTVATGIAGRDLRPAGSTAEGQRGWIDRADLVPFAKLADAIARYQPALAAVADATAISLAQLGAGHDHLAAVRIQLRDLGGAVDQLAAWTRYHLARRAAVDAGLRNVLVAAERGDLDAADLGLAWERATLLAWVAAAIGRAPALVRFDGAAHHTAVASFADLDRGALAVARGRVPRHAACTLAAPADVARHGLGEFDVVIFDEASRLPAAHALDALARGRAAIIVGDARQPGPSGGDDGLHAAALAAGFPELSLSTHYRSRHHDLFAFANRRYYGGAIAQLPAAQHGGALAWHRVDGAPDLAGANRAEAEGVVAEAVRRYRAEPGQSIAIVALSRAQHQLIEDLLDAERGKDRALAAAMSAGAEPLIAGTPDRLHGEVRDVALISTAGTCARPAAPPNGGAVLSPGDAADSLGALAHPGAERWLAVAITRARGHLAIWTSFAPEDVAADAPVAWRDLADLIALARAGGEPVRDDAEPVSPIAAAIARALGERGWHVRHQVGAVELAVVDPDDPQRCVLAIELDGAAYARELPARDRDRLRAQELARLGWRVHRVWTLDWWLDPERETQRAHGAIVAAIAAGRQRKLTPAPIAATAAAAQKKRRRLAQGSIEPQPSALLLAKGPALAAPQVVAQADTDVVPLASGSGPTEAALAAAPASAPALLSPPVRIPRGAIAIGPYVAAAIPPGRRVPNDLFGGRHHAELGKVIEQVLAAEAPIHVELLARRVGAYFGVGRVTPDVLAQIRAELPGRVRFADEPEVVFRADQDPAAVLAVRVAGASAVACRDIAQIPLLEIAAAARIVVERASGLTSNELARDTARLLGFARITERITDRVAQGVRFAASRELIALDNGRAQLTL